jgi:hypothetical protein
MRFVGSKSIIGKEGIITVLCTCMFFASRANDREGKRGVSLPLPPHVTKVPTSELVSNIGESWVL